MTHAETWARVLSNLSISVPREIIEKAAVTIECLLNTSPDSDQQAFTVHPRESHLHCSPMDRRFV